MAYVYTAGAVHVTIFSIGSKFFLVSNFMELHTPTLAFRSYGLFCSHSAQWICLFIICLTHVNVWESMGKPCSCMQFIKRRFFTTGNTRIRIRYYTDGNKLMIFSSIALHYGDTYIISTVSAYQQVATQRELIQST